MSATMMFEVLISFVFKLQVCIDNIGRKVKIENSRNLIVGGLNVESKIMI